MKILASFHVMLCIEYINIVTLLAFAVAITAPTYVRDAYGYFIFIMTGFTILFLIMNIKTICYYYEMNGLLKSVSTALIGNNKLQNSTKAASLNQ